MANIEQKTLGANGSRFSVENLEHKLDAARERVTDLTKSAATFIRERPGTALLIALGAGYFVGRLRR
jgi:hypothetical protein